MSSLAPPTQKHARAWSLTQGLNELDDQRIRAIRPLIPPQILVEDLPVSEAAATIVKRGREQAERIVERKDDRLLVVVGPCSIHDPQAAIAYARLLKAYADKATDDLLIVMRVYFEKPRTTVGWKGLINDPYLNGSFEINKGLRIARQLLLDISEIGLPTGCEFLDTISPQYIADLVSWGAIGARTTESQVHRELSSGLSVPVGFKNGTDGNIGIAIDAIKAASKGHYFLSVTKQGLSAIVSTEGNPYCHVILRGGADGPNYSADHVEKTCSKMRAAGLDGGVMIDCSHGNSSKVYARQSLVATDVAEQLASERTGDGIFGVMIESNLVEGRQELNGHDLSTLTYGQSITDGCLGWTATEAALDRLRQGVQERRARQQASA